MNKNDFPAIFEALTGYSPLPWQKALFVRFLEGKLPKAANIPTGLGKTSIVAIWLIALVIQPQRTPRRLVYVVNRRTVVDQTTAEAERLRNALSKPELREIRDALSDLCALPLPSPDRPLAISTLRGEFADNGEWCADPSRPAIVIGTVDMIGSGLLFSRYTRGFKTRPLHAGFLGQDALLVHDEAHLEPAFQTLLERIVEVQDMAKDRRKLRIIALTATSRNGDNAGNEVLELDADSDNKDTENAIVQKRFNAVKQLTRVELEEKEKLDEKLVILAKSETLNGRAVLIFVRSVETALKVITSLDKNDSKGKVVPLTGTMRGKERDELVSKNPVFQRFLPEKDRAENVTPSTGAVYLVATSAGEVGVNISADDLVCDLSPYESMAQRFGRLNRFGTLNDSTVSVVHETEFDTENKKTGPLDIARKRTLALMQSLGNSASPAALEALPAADRAAAFSPAPKLRIATDIQFDAWALTSIREPIAARPPVAPYLHGEAEWQPPETYLAWRDDRDFQHVDEPEAFLDDFPIEPAELLRDTTARILETLGGLVAKHLQKEGSLLDAWLIDEFGSVKIIKLASFALAAKSKKDRTKKEEEDLARASELLPGATLILPTSIGGLDGGLFTGKENDAASDVSGIIRHETAARDELPAEAARIIRVAEISDENADESRFLLWCAPQSDAGTVIRSGSHDAETLATHTNAVVANAAAIAAKVFLTSPAAGEPDLGRCLVVAAHLHDLGKNRAQWQRNIGNLAYDPAKPDTIFAKSGGKMRSRNVAEHYRHEFGSLSDAVNDAGFSSLKDVERDVVLHLDAAHHGRARPHFPEDESFDYSPDSNAVAIATEVPRRFARLQERFGRWGLAWLESLLRAADYAASAGIVASGQPPAANRNGATASSPITQRPSPPEAKPTATLALDPANPGHYFACCGLFELAARISPDALAWFEKDTATRQCRFHLANTPSLNELLEKIIGAGITTLAPDDATASPILIGVPFGLRVDWWKTAGSNTSALKVWAGTMEAPRIARAMQQAIQSEDGENILACLRIVYSPDNLAKKVEPFYFDANRGPNSDARDIGFSPNDLQMKSLAAPAAEFLTLVGLQRAIPQPSGDRLFDYHLWGTPIPVALLAAAINGFTESSPQLSFRFESWYRTSQRKHKAFLPAKLLGTSHKFNQR